MSFLCKTLWLQLLLGGICTTNLKNPRGSRRFCSRCQFRQFLGADPACGEQRGKASVVGADQGTPFGGPGAPPSLDRQAARGALARPDWLPSRHSQRRSLIAATEASICSVNSAIFS